MQNYAFCSKGELTLATAASRGKDYSCPECRGVVRLRNGCLRSPHFYHLMPFSSCEPKGKSLTHLLIQLHIRDLLAPEEVWLEKSFPTHGRIADVVWPRKKLIFEVQCSPISPLELLKRNRDYQKLGYHVIWIFHDTYFNRSRLTAAEAALKRQLYLFTNFNEEGQGMIYTQSALFHRGKRTRRGALRRIDLKTATLTLNRWQKILIGIGFR